MISSNFAAKFFFYKVSNLKLVGVDLFVSEVSIHVPIVDPEAHRFLACLWVRKFINTLYGFSEVPRDMPNNLEEVVLVERVRDPEGDILVAGRELTVGLELGDLSRRKLVDEPRVLTPEQPDVVDAKQLHCPALKS